MKIEVVVAVYVKGNDGWFQGYFEGIISSPCMYRAGEEIEFPEIGYTYEEENCVTVIKVSHEGCSPNTDRNATFPQAFCLFEFDLTAPGSTGLLQDDLDHWKGNTLAELAKRLGKFHSEGFEKIEIEKPTPYRRLPYLKFK